MLPVALLVVAAQGRKHLRHVFVKVFQPESHLLISSQLIDAILRGEFECSQRDQELASHFERSITSQSDFLVDVAISLLDQGWRVENEYISLWLLAGP